MSTVNFNGETYDEETFEQAAAVLRSNSHGGTSPHSWTRHDYTHLLGQQYGNERDIYDVLGYDKTPTAEDYRAKYRRQDIAKRLVELPAKDTWKHPPDVTDTEDSTSDSEFEKALQQLVDEKQLWNTCSRADITAGIGEYGLLFMGFSDGQPLDEPVNEGAINGLDDLVFMSPYAQDHVVDWDLGRDMDGEHDASDPSHPRYNKPVQYTISFADIDDDLQDEEHWRDVHWTRVMHYAEGKVESDLKGTPRLEAVYNRLDDLEKVVGASAEMFWSGADRKFQFNVNTDDGGRISDNALSDLDEEVERLVHDMQQHIKTINTDVEVIGGEDPDPSAIVGELMSFISGTSGIPQRMLTGSERGELASSQDRATWYGRIESRQNRYAGPEMLRPLLDRLIQYGILPTPQGGEYDIEWPSLFELTDVEQAEMWQKRATALKNIAPKGNTTALIDDRDALFDFLMEGEKPDFDEMDDGGMDLTSDQLAKAMREAQAQTEGESEQDGEGDEPEGQRTGEEQPDGTKTLGANERAQSPAGEPRDPSAGQVQDYVVTLDLDDTRILKEDTALGQVGDGPYVGSGDVVTLENGISVPVLGIHPESHKPVIKTDGGETATLADGVDYQSVRDRAGPPQSVDLVSEGGLVRDSKAVGSGAAPESPSVSPGAKIETSTGDVKEVLGLTPADKQPVYRRSDGSLTVPFGHYEVVSPSGNAEETDGDMGQVDSADPCAGNCADCSDCGECAEPATNAEFSPGDRVETPDNGFGVVDDRLTEGNIEGTDLEPTDDEPVYAVATEDSGVEFYKASDLEAVDDFGIPDDIRDQGKEELKQSENSRYKKLKRNARQVFSGNDWTHPETWREADTPARLILLDAWASMGGQFDCGGACCKGDLKSDRLCAAMKDAALGTTQWRNGWTD